MCDTSLYVGVFDLVLRGDLELRWNILKDTTEVVLT